MACSISVGWATTASCGSTTARPKKVFDQLALKASLAPGEMLIMSSLPDRAGSIGHYFFNQPDADQPRIGGPR